MKTTAMVTAALVGTALHAEGADNRARRYDAPAARGITRYDAPSTRSNGRVDAPAAHNTRYRAPAQHRGSAYTAPGTRHTTEFRA
jgi:hypothetical protein